jgi:predicted permease
MMAKHPALTLVGGLGIAVGIAISVCFFAVTRIYIYPELPLDEGERVVALEDRDITVNNEERQALHDFFTWREELRTIEDLTAFRTIERNLIVAGETPELVQVAQMTAAGFSLARVPPLHGRTLVPDDEREGALSVLVIGYHVWQNRFNGDPGIVGREARLGGTVHTIVGVMPEGFAFPENHRLWIPLRENPLAYERRSGPAIFIAGRLAPAVTMEMAQAELSAIGERTSAAFPESHEMIRPMVMPYTHSLTDVQGITVWEVTSGNLMMSLFLIIVTLNVAVLVYARTAARHGEVAVRNALGASRGRIVGQLFIESLVLSLVAAAAGVLLARVGMGMADRIMAAEMDVGTPFWMDYRLRLDTILFAVGLAVLTAVITGVLPALQATGRRLQSHLRALGGSAMRLGRIWTGLIVTQVAIAVAALPAVVNTALTEIRGAMTQRTFAAEQYVTASIAPDFAPAASDAASNATPVPLGNRLTELIRRLEAEPTVAGVTFGASLPGRGNFIRVEGLPVPAEYAAGHPVSSVGVHPTFPAVMGARIIRGRALSATDIGVQASSVIVTETFVRRVLGGGDAIGRRIRHVSAEEIAGSGITGPVRWYEIVGVMADLVSNSVAPELVTPTLYYPIGADQVPRAGITVHLRGATPLDFAPRFREIAAEVDPDLRLGTVRSLADSNRQQQTAARLVGLAVGLVLLCALLLSAAGVYAMMSFTVTQRRREIGIRSALGAQPAAVLRSIFARSAVQVAGGVGIGVAMGALADQLGGGDLLDGRGPVLLPSIALLMMAVGLLAALGPARRGLRIQPTEALRGEG